METTYENFVTVNFKDFPKKFSYKTVIGSICCLEKL